MKTKEEIREATRIRNIEWRKKNREVCCNATAAWRAKNPTYESNRKLKERYGITSERYEEMWKSQNGRCAICGNEETAINYGTKKVQALAVDHCHKTEKVRELLCQDCNRGIAKFNEDPVRLQRAIDYIIKHQ